MLTETSLLTLFLFVVCFSLTHVLENLFNLKFAAKELNRNSKKCDKEEKTEKVKVKKVSRLSVATICINKFCPLKMLADVDCICVASRLSRRGIWKLRGSMQRMPSDKRTSL